MPINYANRFRDSKAFKVGCSMPTGLNHKPNENFDWAESEVVAWLIEQPEIQSYIFDKMKDAAAIIYNPETGTWQGSDA